MNRTTHTKAHQKLKIIWGMVTLIALCIFFATLHDKEQRIRLIIEVEKVRWVAFNLHVVVMAGILILLIFFGLYLYLQRFIAKHYSLHRALTKAIQYQQFFPVYQPITDICQNTCCGAEVLLRWQASEYDVILPDNFVPYAEKTSLILPITLQLAKQVFTDCAALLQERPDFHLAINLSSLHFTDPHFMTSFIALCQTHSIRCEQIMLEVTERDLIQQDAVILPKMQALRQAGFSIAIDDFGTGNANISYLQRFPFNYLKMDRLFVSSIGTGAVTESLSLSIIEMAHRLGLQVIAEGVETKAQLDCLERHGAFLIQGWYFSKALHFGSFIHYLQDLRKTQINVIPNAVRDLR